MLADAGLEPSSAALDVVTRCVAFGNLIKFENAILYIGSMTAIIGLPAET